MCDMLHDLTPNIPPHTTHAPRSLTPTLYPLPCLCCCCCCWWCQVAEAERSAAFSQLVSQDREAAVTSILDGLSFAGGTMEALTAPPQEPEEWTPEVRGGDTAGHCVWVCEGVCEGVGEGSWRLWLWRQGGWGA